jgi:hypothetical protein
MPRVDLLSFSDMEISRIYIAGKVPEAKNVEALLNSRGIDYAVEMEEFKFFSFFGWSHVGAAFYVLSAHAQFCRGLLKGQGLVRGILEE